MIQWNEALQKYTEIHNFGLMDESFEAPFYQHSAPASKVLFVHENERFGERIAFLLDEQVLVESILKGFPLTICLLVNLK